MTAATRASSLIAGHIIGLGRAAEMIHGKPNSVCLMNEISHYADKVRRYAAELAKDPDRASHIAGMLGPNGHGPGIDHVVRRALNFDANQAAYLAARSPAALAPVKRRAATLTHEMENA